MKKIDKKGIVKLIFLIIFLIMQIKAFDNSRANKLTYITAKIVDFSGLLSEETSTLVAINEGDNGMAITLPNILNTKKVSKYFITKKKIIENESTEEPETIEETVTEESITVEEKTTTEEVVVEEEIVTTEDDVIDEENLTTEEDVVEDEVLTTEEDVIEDEISTTEETVEMLPGDKIYLTQEEIETLEITLKVQYDTIENDTLTLYNKTLTVKDTDDYELLSVSGYMPHDTEIENKEIDILDLENEIIEKYPDSILIGNYDIKLISNETEYIAKDYNQTLKVEMTIIDSSKTHYVLEIQEENKIQQLKEIKIEDNKIKFETDELKTYLVLEMQNGPVTYEEENTTQQDASANINSIAVSVDGSDAKLEIDDYESDKNYYTGLNYTEGMSKQNSGKYTESNLKEVIINYYGYDYHITEFVEPEIYDITLNATASRSATGTVNQSGNGNNRVYTRIDTITCTVSGIRALQEQYPEFNADSGWTMQMAVPNTNFSNYFSEANTTTQNSSAGISVSVSNGIITVIGSDTSSLKGNNDTWTFTFKVAFSNNNRNNINNLTYTTFTVNSFESRISIGEEYTPYGTISDTELKTLISYKKCVPADSNGNIKLELIDNPFMNRPKERGFNGWKTNDTRYANSISINENTYKR